MAKNTSCGVQLRIRGKVQGVGFRPFVWQLAQQLNLHGDVCNDGDGVEVRLLEDPEVEIVHIGYSSACSCSFQNATISLQDCDEKRIHLIDCLNVSGGFGLLTLKAVELHTRNPQWSAAEQSWRMKSASGCRGLKPCSSRKSWIFWQPAAVSAMRQH